MKKIITIVVAVVMLALSLTACGASSEFQGKYVNTRESKSYIEVTGEHTCNLVKVYTEID